MEEQQINDIEKALISLTALVGTLKSKIADAGVATKKADAAVVEVEAVKANLRERINAINTAKNELIVREEAVKQRELAQRRIDNLIKMEQDIEFARVSLENDRKLFAKRCRVDRDLIATKMADIHEAKKKLEALRVDLEEDRRVLEAEKVDFANQKSSMDLQDLNNLGE